MYEFHDRTSLEKILPTINKTVPEDPFKNSRLSLSDLKRKQQEMFQGAKEKYQDDLDTFATSPLKGKDAQKAKANPLKIGIGAFYGNGIGC